MRRTPPDLSGEIERRVARLRARNPDWSSWLALLGVIWEAHGDPVWATVRAERDAPVRLDAAPVLHGQVVHTNLEALRELLRRLAAAAAPPDAPLIEDGRLTTDVARELVEASLRHDARPVDVFAARCEVEPGPLHTIAALAGIPLLSTISRRVADQVPTTWAAGYCPICSGWPALAELIGLDQTRHLRCGRCGGDWLFGHLRCPYCGESDHRRLGGLVVEDAQATERAETCERCKGYIKTVTTLQPQSLPELQLRDLETVELDLAARERGYDRPGEPGFRIDVRVLG